MAPLRPISDVARDLGLSSDEALPAGPQVLKVPLAVVRRRADGPKGRLVLVTAMTPTSHGEGKTVVSIGLAMALRRLGHRAVVCLRQPSLGPVFGLKGGASGGGRSTVEPAEEVNLGLTGDLSAIADAHNLLAALLENHLYHGNALDLQRSAISWPRTLDVEDRVLRHIVVDAGGGEKAVARESSFVIAAASELTAIHGLVRDVPDLKARIGRILVGERGEGLPARAGDVQATGAMAALLRSAIKPNLLQTCDGTPALVHGGPFANIAHGTTTRLSIELALATTDFAVVEAGFSTELGAEKFVDIVARSAGFQVAAAVLIATLRGLRRQGGVPDASQAEPNPAAVERGLDNLGRHIANLRALSLTPLIALNRFPGDTPEEIELVRRFAGTLGVPIEEVSPFTDGADGALDLARRVAATDASGARGRPLYPDGTGIADAIRTIATTLYGASDVRFAPQFDEDLRRLTRYGELAGPVCIAKTPLSLTDDPKRVGPVHDFVPTVRRLWRAAGAGFTVAYLGTIETMPGLPSHPLADRIDLTDDGRVVGLG
ncbi:MAG TPA: formate--tetrahydrofolate ligase [Thermoplasmata archaeon]|nr:formate--tetrahydrofolate ligase [Thermoplasmata archaeon]